MAPLTAGTNCLTKIEDAIVNLLANTTAVQTFLGEANATAAKGRIFLHTIPEAVGRDAWNATEWLAKFPCVIITGPEDGDVLRLSASSRDEGLGFDLHSKFSVRLEAYAAENETNDEEIARLFLEKAGQVVDDIRDRVGTAAGEYQFTGLALNNVYRGRYDRYVTLGDTLGIKLEIESVIT